MLLNICFVPPVFLRLLFVEIIGFAGFVADHVGERERVAERLEQEAVENPINGPQHFWQGEYNARVLATLKDRVWRGVILVERCRATLNRIHEVMFPSDPRVQGINALLECFRGGSADPKFYYGEASYGCQRDDGLHQKPTPNLDVSSSCSW